MFIRYLATAILSFICLSTAHAAPKEPGTQSAQITIFMIATTTDNVFSRLLESSIEVIVDRKNVGTVDNGQRLSFSLPIGSHKIRVTPSGGLASGSPESTVHVTSNKPLYFFVTRGDNGAYLNPVDAATAQAELGETRGKSGGKIKLYVFWPWELLDSAALDALKPDFEIAIDGKVIGAITSGDYIAAELSSGKHVIEIRSSLLPVTLAENDFFVSANKSFYVRVSRYQSTSRDRFAMSAVSPETGATSLKELRKR